MAQWYNSRPYDLEATGSIPARRQISQKMRTTELTKLSDKFYIIALASATVTQIPSLNCSKVAEGDRERR